MCDLRVGTFQTTVKDPVNGATHSPALPGLLGQRSCLKCGMPGASFSINKTSNHVADVEMFLCSYEIFSHFLPRDRTTHTIKGKEAWHRNE